MTSTRGFWPRGGLVPGSVSAEAIRALAALLRGGAGPRSALIDWHRDAPSELASALSRLSRRLALGAPTDEALSCLQTRIGVVGPALAGIFVAHARLGGDIARMLDSLARQVERREASLEAARAAGAGAVLSGRIVAGLPMLFLLFAPSGRAPLLDGVGLTMLAVGGALAVGGMLWIERLVPSAEALDDPAALVADVTAGVLDGGAGLSCALEVVSIHSPESIRPAFGRARRLVRLGAAWPEALLMCRDDDLGGLASSVRRAETQGLPLARSLEAWAGARRSRKLREFEVATKRAPVLMVVPLTMCVLPSYIVLALGPLLRGI